MDRPLLAVAAFAFVSFTIPCRSEDQILSEARHQQNLAKQLGSKVQRFEMWTNERGQVTGLILINHQALNRETGPKPGINDDDLKRLIRLPELERLNLESQAIGDRGLESLRSLNLKQVGFHYMAKHPGAAASPDFITAIDGMTRLEILEIKHNFGMKSIHVHKLNGPFPKVWRLVLDTPLTADQTMHLIRLCPGVSELQLHRTTVTPDQLREIGRVLPKLEVLWLKPRGDLSAEHLRAVAEFPRLRFFSPQQFKNTLPYQDGWEALTHSTSLERLEIQTAQSEANAEGLEALKRQRPSLIVTPSLTRSRNYRGI